MSEWLNNLKAGDPVITCSGYYGKSKNVVERVTATQVILAGGGKYRKSDGRMVGGDQYSITYITEPTETLLVEIQKKSLCEKLRRVVWEKVNVDTLVEIFEKAKNGQHLTL